MAKNDNLEGSDRELLTAALLNIQAATLAVMVYAARLADEGVPVELPKRIRLTAYNLEEAAQHLSGFLMGADGRGSPEHLIRDVYRMRAELWDIRDPKLRADSPPTDTIN